MLYMKLKRSAYNGRNQKTAGGLEGRLYDGIFDDPDDPYFTDDDPDALDPSTIF